MSRIAKALAFATLAFSCHRVFAGQTDPGFWTTHMILGDAT